MRNLFLWYPQCSTCKKAKKWLDDNNIDYELRNIVLDNPTKEELTKWINESNLDIKKFFNTSGMKYRSLNLKEKLNEMTDGEKIEVLASDGMLVKRPLIIGKVIIPGFKNYESLK
jgi:arsenate reductase